MKNPATNEHKDQASKPVDELKRTERIIYDLLTVHKTYNPKDFPTEDHFVAARIASHIHRYFILKDELTQFTQELIEGLPKKKNVTVENAGVPSHNWSSGMGFDEALDAATQSIKATLTKYTGGKS